MAAVLAGCGDAGGGDGTDGVTPTATPPPTPPDADWADGERLDVAALETAHVETLADAGSYAVTSVADTDHEGESRPDPWLPSQRVEEQFEARRQRQLFRQELGGNESVTYVADGRAYVRRVVDGEVRYRVESAERTEAGFRESFRGTARTGVPGLREWDVRFDGPAPGDAAERYRYVGDGFAGDRDVPAETADAAATVLIESRGLAALIDRTFEGETDGQAVTVRIGIDFGDVGNTRISEPDWLGKAEAAAGGNETATESGG